MTRSATRKTVQLISLLLFPLTLNFFSPYLIIRGSFTGIVSGSALLFLAQFLTALFFGRAFCGWVCPGGALQEATAAIQNRPTRRQMNRIKYFVWAPWLLTITAGFVSAGGIRAVLPLYMTPGGISVNQPENFIMYYFVVGLIALTSLLFGRHAFCHALCWMAPFLILADRLRRRLRYPSLHLQAEATRCVDCKRCESHCPMSLPVSNMARKGDMTQDECILCGACADVCPKDVIHFRLRYPKRSGDTQAAARQPASQED